MTIFILSQLLGLVVFTTVSFGIYAFILYKRNQAFKVSSPSKPIRYRIATAILLLFFCAGFGFKMISIRDGVEQIVSGRVNPTREEKIPILD